MLGGTPKHIGLAKVANTPRKGATSKCKAGGRYIPFGDWDPSPPTCLRQHSGRGSLKRPLRRIREHFDATGTITYYTAVATYATKGKEPTTQTLAHPLTKEKRFGSIYDALNVHELGAAPDSKLGSRKLGGGTFIAASSKGRMTWPLG